MASTRDYDDTAHTNPDKDPLEVIDSSNMKVEEKIARAYHRDLSWRKVLVKIEPDAHNNLIVRRMFANAFGWPVVKHLVDAHFSDSATARTKDENAPNVEQANEIAQPPDSHGNETKDEPKDESPSSESSPGRSSLAVEGGLAPRPRPRQQESDRTESEIREAEDSVTDLPSSSYTNSVLHSAASPSLSARPMHDRLDSMTWSDRDWLDSADESDVEDDMAYGGNKGPEDRNKKGLSVQTDRGKVPDASASPSGGAWNWTEKIVGKSASKKVKSPTSPRASQGLPPKSPASPAAAAAMKAAMAKTSPDDVD